MFYAKSTGGFYDTAIHGDAIPSDAVEITVEEHTTLLDGQSSGKRIVAAADGRPVLADPPAPTFDELKAAKNTEINLARATANTSTFTHDDKAFSCDALSRSDIDGVNGYAALYGALPPAFPGAWKAADNSYYPIADLAAWKAFYASMVATGAANFTHAQTLKAQLAAAITPDAVAAIVW